MELRSMFKDVMEEAEVEDGLLNDLEKVLFELVYPTPPSQTQALEFWASKPH